MTISDYPASIERARLALGPVREECQARLERLRHEFELAVTARGNGSIQQGVAN